jgi:hypothetical protein
MSMKTGSIDREELRRELMRVINAKPFDITTYHDGQYAGLRMAVRILDDIAEMPPPT